MSGIPPTEIAGFDYSVMRPSQAKKVRVAAHRIRTLVRQSVEGIIEIGNELLNIKAALPHGEFGEWLDLEFGWSERSARNFINVARRFKSANFADLEIDPSAAYLLASPSAPDRALRVAIERAADGEHVTSAVAKDILAQSKDGRRARAAGRTTSKRETTRHTLRELRQDWPQQNVQDLVALLRAFADELERGSPVSIPPLE